MDASILMNPKNPPTISRHPLSNDPSIWFTALKRQARLKDDRAILASYAKLKSAGIRPNSDILPLVLKACARLQNMGLGKRIHDDISGTYLLDNIRVRTALVDFYCKCGLLEDALDLFEEMSQRDIVAWNAMISGYVGNFRYVDAIEMFMRMTGDGLKPSAVTLVTLLSACAQTYEFRIGQQIHCYCLRNGLFDSGGAHLGAALIGFYSKFDVKYSQYVFGQMRVMSVVCFNAILSAYLSIGKVTEALELFIQIIVMGVAVDHVTLLAVTQLYAEYGSLELGKAAHQLVIKYGLDGDIFIANALIDMYGKCGSLDMAFQVFQNMHTMDTASWNAIIAACKNCSEYDRPFFLFEKMKVEGAEENIVTIATLLAVCTECSDIDRGNQLHAYAIKTGVCRKEVIQNALLGMYVGSKNMDSAHEIFNQMERPTLVSSNLMIMGFVKNDLANCAWLAFKDMVQKKNKPNSYTMIALLAGCKDESALNIGKSIHGFVIRNDLEVNSPLCTALADMYMNCGYQSTAEHLFWTSPTRDVVSWNAMLASYVRNGQPQSAINFLYLMQFEARSNSITLLIILTAIMHIANLPQGKCSHAYILRNKLSSGLDNCLENALLVMYAKCGCILEAEKIFKNIQHRDVVSWNAMILAYGIHGQAEEALCVFYRMLEAGLKPTSVTFVSLLSSCSHCGLVENGLELFNSMHGLYNIKPEVVHYSCMVDLLGRSGRLNEAINLIHSMPIETDASVWRALLAACTKFSNIELVRIAGKRLIELEPMNIGNYILVSNIYAGVGSWENVKQLRTLIRKMGLRKPPGKSWLAIRDTVECFNAGNISGPVSVLSNQNLDLSFQLLTPNGLPEVGLSSK